MKRLMASALVLATCLSVATAANATTKDFTIDFDGGPAGAGSFSYASSDTGVIGLNELTSFDITLDPAASLAGDEGGTESFTLGDLLKADESHFSYDSTTNSFLVGAPPSNLISDLDMYSGGYISSYSGSSAGSFIVGRTAILISNPTPSADGGLWGGVVCTGAPDCTSISITNGTPEPASWALMILGLGGLGVALRRRRAAIGAIG